MSVHDRLREVRTTLKMSIREFSKEISYSHGVYGSVEKGSRPLSDRILQLIVSRFGVSKNWILTGKGQMFDSGSQPDPRLEKILEIYNTIDPTLKECLLEQSKILLKIHKDKKK